MGACEQGSSMGKGRHSGVMVAAALGTAVLAMAACTPAPATPEPATHSTAVPPLPPTAAPPPAASPSHLLATPGSTVGSSMAKVRFWANRPGQGSPPDLLQHVRVLPIAQSAVNGGVEMTALSLEAYTDGFLVTLRVVTAEARPRTPESHAFPDFAFQVTDDRGRTYEAWPQGGGGSGRQWRYTQVFTPALDPAARELRLEAPELPWWRMGSDSPDPTEAQLGPWRFVVPLQGEGREGP
jgi:hypothetical protein